ncbi:hypothetical protein SQ03_29165 [Methylobacterium platani JCM 14648]|uniref:DarT domain-containing protein n=3 Tax=Methylobacterium platani TaxID=427683 RepID=A0A179SAD3_9HYPH|nr:hypothetical protein SQ03_29165 [Methylobacterium platani JCM 14648]OAS24410.1 hypothetical protein A5481_14095 [Methylobacterium platani]
MFGMDAYVHLCFMNDHPMEYKARNEGRVQNTVWLRIDPAIIKQAGVRITNGVSNRSDMVTMDPSTQIDTLDLEVIYQGTDWKDPEIKKRRIEAKKYEILVPDSVPLQFIRNIDG